MSDLELRPFMLCGFQHMLWRFNLHDSKIKVELEREQAKNPELKQLLKVFGGVFFLEKWFCLTAKDLNPD